MHQPEFGEDGRREGMYQQTQSCLFPQLYNYQEDNAQRDNNNRIRSRFVIRGVGTLHGCNLTDKNSGYAHETRRYEPQVKD